MKKKRLNLPTISQLPNDPIKAAYEICKALPKVKPDEVHNLKVYLTHKLKEVYTFTTADLVHCAYALPKGMCLEKIVGSGDCIMEHVNNSSDFSKYSREVMDLGCGYQLKRKTILRENFVRLLKVLAEKGYIAFSVKETEPEPAPSEF